jgi:hypothetical protein
MAPPLIFPSHQSRAVSFVGSGARITGGAITRANVLTSDYEKGHFAPRFRASFDRAQNHFQTLMLSCARVFGCRIVLN